MSLHRSTCSSLTTAASGGTNFATTTTKPGFLCTICQRSGHIRHVAVLGCGHLFHRHCIAAWLEENDRCAVCNQNASRSATVWRLRQPILEEDDETSTSQKRKPVTHFRCAYCLRAGRLDSVAVLRCGDCFHLPCLERMRTYQSLCPGCGEETTNRDVIKQLFAATVSDVSYKDTPSSGSSSSSNSSSNTYFRRSYRHSNPELEGMLVDDYEDDNDELECKSSDLDELSFAGEADELYEEDDDDSERVSATKTILTLFEGFMQLFGLVCLLLFVAVVMADGIGCFLHHDYSADGSRNRQFTPNQQ